MPDSSPILLVGSGGLVGSHIRVAAMTRRHRLVTVEVPWRDPVSTVAVLLQAVSDMIRDVPVGQGWTLVWAAGAGVVASAPVDLARELDVFTEFMTGVGRVAEGSCGAVVLMSSAGGVYAGSDGPPFTEATAPRPLVAYGRVKLAMEQAATEGCVTARLPLAVLRLSNVYGPGQRLDKSQGLISQICRSVLTGAPLPVMVSLDTLRDYVFAPDVAGLVLDVVERLQERRPEEPIVKIVASGQSVSVGHLIGVARRITRRPLRTVAVRGRSAGQAPDLRFRSLIWPDLDHRLSTPLPVGLTATARDLLARHGQNGLVGPRP